MEIKSTIRLVGNIYNVEVGLNTPSTTALTPVEQEAIDSFGEPVIECGGDFTDGEALEYTLDANDRYFPSQFPVKQQFSLADYPDDANARAVVFRDAIESRLEAAVIAKRAEAIGVVGVNITTVDTTPP